MMINDTIFIYGETAKRGLHPASCLPKTRMFLLLIMAALVLVDCMKEYPGIGAIDMLPAIYSVPETIELDGTNTATISIRLRGLESCDRMHFVFSGATIDSVKRAESFDKDSLQLFTANNVADILLNPHADRFQGDSMQLLDVYISMPEHTDSSHFSFTCSARDMENEEIRVDMIRGTTILRK